MTIELLGTLHSHYNAFVACAQSKDRKDFAPQCIGVSMALDAMCAIIKEPARIFHPKGVGSGNVATFDWLEGLRSQME